MGADYIPRRDSKFKLWAETFVSMLRQDPPRFAMTQAQADYLQTLLDGFVGAMARCVSEDTRTRPNTLSKNNARHKLESLCRTYARQIKDNLGVDDADKIALGIRPINPVRTRIHCPQTNPDLHIAGTAPGRHLLRYKDPFTDGSAKPHGASDLLLFMALSNHRGAPRSEAKFVGKFTRNPILMKFTQEQDGLVATYYARWASERGETGPFSIPISMRIAA